MPSQHYKDWGYDPEMNVEQVAVTSTNVIYTTSAGDTLYGFGISDGINPTVKERDNYTFGGSDPFTNIISIAIGSNDYVWILDDTGTHAKLGTFELDSSWKFKGSWDITTPTSHRISIANAATASRVTTGSPFERVLAAGTCPAAPRAVRSSSASVASVMV